MALKIINKIGSFVKQHGEAMDRSLNRMAIDIHRLSAMRVPVKEGLLKGSARHFRVGFLHYRTLYNKEYAAYQEFGGDGHRVVRRYTTPGTGKLYLRRSGDEIKAKAMQYFKQESARIKV